MEVKDLKKESEIRSFIEKHRKEIRDLKRYVVRYYLFSERYVEVGIKLNRLDDPASWTVDIAENGESEMEFYAIYWFEGIGECVADDYENMQFLGKQEIFRDRDIYLDRDRNIVSNIRFKVIVSEDEMRERILRYYLRQELREE